MATKFINVKSGRNDNRVALWEKHPNHPDGEAWVAGDTVVRVAQTSAVLKGLKDGDLVEADEAPAKKKTAAAETPTPPAEPKEPAK
jgi:hypothetical protein